MSEKKNRTESCQKIEEKKSERNLKDQPKSKRVSKCRFFVFVFKLSYKIVYLF